MRRRPAENWLAHAYGDVMSSASKMAASLHPASRKRSTSAFSISSWTADTCQAQVYQGFPSGSLSANVQDFEAIILPKQVRLPQTLKLSHPCVLCYSERRVTSWNCSANNCSTGICLPF